MEKFFFKRIEVWLVLLLFVLGIVGAIIFGAMVRNVERGFDRFGAVGRLAHAIASVPADARKLLRAKDADIMAVKNSDRFAGRQGWVYTETDTAKNPDGYLLFSRFDGDVGRAAIEMLDLTSRRVVYRVTLDADTLLDGATRDSNLADFSAWNTRNYRAIHPYALDGGDLIFKDQWSPLMRTNACGELVWRLENNLYHHTTEVGIEGNFWLTTTIEPTQVEGLSEEFFDDAIALVSADGEVLYERSLTQVMIDAGLGNILFSSRRFDVDPIHLNDVQPVPGDGPYWRAGDVFLSLRHSSMIILFRPSTDKIIWTKQGPWAAQHDVDIIDDKTIAVFNNNMFNLGNGEFVDGTSDILFYDFSTDTVRSPYKDIFDKYQIKTEFAGLFGLLPSGHLLIEESSAGRFLIFAPDGTLVAENVNRADDGLIYHQGWSRFVDRARGDGIVAAMLAQNCN